MFTKSLGYLWKHNVHYVLLGISLFILLLFSNPVFTSNDQLIVKMLYLVIFVLSIVTSIYFVVEFRQSENLYEKTDENKLNYRFGALIIIVVSFFVFFPLMSQNYLFYDDYWSLAPITTTSFDPSYGRPITSLLRFAFSFISIKNVIYIRWLTVFGQIIFALLLYKWAALKMQNNFKALILTISISFLSPFIDGISYGSTFPYSLGIALAGASVIVADYAIIDNSSNKLKKVVMFGLSLVCIFASFNIYQITTQIVFLFLGIHLIFSKKSKSKPYLVLIYGLIFIVAALAYFFILKIYASTSGQSISDRGALISSVTEMKGKISYFYSILIQTSNQILVSLFGKNLFSYIGRINVNLFVRDFPNQEKYSVILISFACITLIKQIFKDKNVVTFLLLISFVPASFYTFLILKESSYVSYYVFPLAAIIMLYICCSIFDVIKVLNVSIKNISKRDIDFKYLATILAVLVAFQGSLYVSQFWVYYNKSGYEYIKNSIVNNIQSCNRIHIYGVLYPGQGNIYSVFAVKTILREMNIDESKIVISTSDNAYYASILQDEDYNNIYSLLTNDEKMYFDSIYMHDTTYGRHLITRTNFTNDEMNLLQKIFVKANVLPSDTNTTTIVDLSWVNHLQE